jgi:hypothetical protein
VRSAQLFGWDLKSLWLTANQKRCHALLEAGKLAEAHEAYRYMMDMSDEAKTVNCSDWSIGTSLAISLTMILTRVSLSFRARMPGALHKQRGCCPLFGRLRQGYRALLVGDSASDTIFASRCTAKLRKMLWEDALLGARKVR